MNRYALKYKIIFLILFAIIVSIFFVFSKAKQSKGVENILKGDTIFAQNLNIAGGQTISGYSPKALDWNIISTNMTKNLDRLKNEYGIVYDSSALSNTLNPSGKPEGQIWYNNGNLTMNGATINGKGTIIVYGNLTINGDLSYGDNESSIGFIVSGGSISISSGVKNLVGAYYSDGGITFH